MNIYTYIYRYTLYTYTLRYRKPHDINFFATVSFGDRLLTNWSLAPESKQHSTIVPSFGDFCCRRCRRRRRHLRRKSTRQYLLSSRVSQCLHLFHYCFLFDLCFYFGLFALFYKYNNASVGRLFGVWKLFEMFFYVCFPIFLLLLMFEHFAFISDLAGDFYCDVSQNALWVPVVVILGTAYVFILYNVMIRDNMSSN